MYNWIAVLIFLGLTSQFMFPFMENSIAEMFFKNEFVHWKKESHMGLEHLDGE